MGEMELGITGGEEDGVDNSDVDSSRLYTQPSEVWEVYQALSSVPNGNFTVAAAFGNVHGVYAPGNVELRPEILHNTQKFIKEKLGTDTQWAFWDGMRQYEAKHRDYLQAQIGNPEGP